MAASIFAFLQALPELIKLVNSVGAYLLKVSGNDPAGFVIRANNAFTLLSKANTEQEMIDAAKAIQDAIRHTH